MADPSAGQWAPVMGLTHCNQFARAVCRAMGAELPDALANAQAEWLGTPAAVLAGWAPASEAVARQWCEGGGLALATYRNAHPGAHGHIAPLTAAVAGVTHIANVGAKNFRRGKLQRGFGDLPVAFYTHHPLRTCHARPDASP